MHFKTAYLKLTLFYVLVAMIVSIGFSIAIFKISSNELGRGLVRQTGILRNFEVQSLPQKFPSIEQLKVDQLKESRGRLKNNLIYYNLLILLISSIAGYFLARKTLQPIEKAMDSQNRFTADASHELRTPLTAMRAEIEVNLKDSKLSLDNAKKLLASNLEEVSKLESLSNALLKLARYQEDKATLQELVNLEEILAESYGKVEKLAERKSIEFENNLRDISIRGDRQSFVELFVILLDNAIKYSPEKSIIKIDMSSDHNEVVVKIKDRGIGIKSSDIPFIFNRFYRADTSRSKEKVDGYGLGLSIAQRIVDMQGGKISVASKPGIGSEFTVKFKL